MPTLALGATEGVIVDNNGASTAISSVITGSAGLTIGGGGTVTLSGTNTYNNTSAVQNLPFGGTVTGGTFTLTLNGLTSAAIAYSTTAATLQANIQAALNVLASVGLNNASVSASSAHVGHDHLHGRYSGQPVTAMTAPSIAHRRHELAHRRHHGHGRRVHDHRQRHGDARQRECPRRRRLAVHRRHAATGQHLPGRHAGQPVQRAHVQQQRGHLRRRAAPILFGTGVFGGGDLVNLNGTNNLISVAGGHTVTFAGQAIGARAT